MKRKRFSIIALVLAVGLAALSACAPTPEPEPAPTPTPKPEPTPLPSAGYEGTVDGVAFSLPDLGNAVALHTELQEQYLKERAPGSVNKYANGVNAGDGQDHRELSYPVPVSFRWTAGEGESYTLTVSEKEDFSDALTFETEETSYDVYNLKAGTTYYWTVTAGEAVSGAAVFSTATRAPRNLYVDGVANVRDVGGWATADGGTVKQGLFYRGGRLTKDYFGDVTASEAGIATLRDVLKIKTELDLRGGVNDPSEAGNLTSSAIGEGVAYRHIGMNWEGNLFELNHEELKEIFALLADENNYPVYMHCSIGTDRTGIVSYLVNGLLGVADFDLYRDYLFSNFAYIQGAREINTITKGYGATISGYGGDTTAESVRLALLAIGVPEAHLDAVKRILG